MRTLKLRDLPDDERPRERLQGHGAAALDDAELLAVVLGSGAPGRDALATAHALVAAFPDLRRLAAAGLAELAAVPGVGRAQALRVKAALALATRLVERPRARVASIRGPADVHSRLAARLVPLEHEVFVALALDVKHRVIAERQLAMGGVCSVEIVPRDVFALLVREAAAAAIVVHNHPSGDPSPSDADRRITDRLHAAGQLVGVPVVDHVIVATGSYYSFAEGRRAPAGTFSGHPRSEG
jgi:DNA repair protein RadC